MKILIVSLILFFLVSTSAVAGFYEPLGDGLLVASSQGNGNEQQPAPGKIIIKGKGGKVTDVEQKPDDEKEKEEDKKDD